MLRGELELRSAVSEGAKLVHQIASTELGEEIDKPRAADSLHVGVADGRNLDRFSLNTDRLDCAVVAGHSVGDLATFECGPSRTRGGHQAVAVTDHDLGVGADVNEHYIVVFLVYSNGEQIGCYIRPDMTANDRTTIDVRSGEDTQSNFTSCRVQGGGVSNAAAILYFDDRPVRLLANRLDVYIEEHVPHSGVADDHDLVDLSTVEAERTGHIADLEVNRREHHLPQLSVELASIVGNAVHDVASAEALRVFERRSVDDIA